MAIVALLLLGFEVLGAAWGWVLAIILTLFLALYFLEKRLFPVTDAFDRGEPLNTERVKIKLGVWYDGSRREKHDRSDFRRCKKS